VLGHYVYMRIIVFLFYPQFLVIPLKLKVPFSTESDSL